MPPEMRTRATLRRAEFGFLGVVVYTRVQTPRRCGAATFFLRPLPDFRPGVASFLVFGWRPLRTSWEVVGMRAGHGSSARAATRRVRAAPQSPGAPATRHACAAANRVRAGRRTSAARARAAARPGPSHRPAGAPLPTGRAAWWL